MSYHIINYLIEVGVMTKSIEPSIPGRLGITGEEKELLYKFLRDEIGKKKKE